MMPPLKLCFDEAQILELAEKYPKRYAKSDTRVCEAGRAARMRGHLIREEFLDIARWKSPRPAKSYERNTDGEIKLATQSALKAARDLERIVALTALSGIRVRTATAILHVCHQASCPLLDVWAMTALGVPREQTDRWDEFDWLRAYPEYTAFCRRLAQKTGQTLRIIDKAL